MANDTKVIGRKYRVLANAATRAWNVLSFWTSARDVEFDDGSTLQNVKATIDGTRELAQNLLTNVSDAPVYNAEIIYSKGDIVNTNGTLYYCTTNITSPEAWTPSHWHVVDDEMTFQFGIDNEGNYGYIKVGADSVTPFKKGGNIITVCSQPRAAYEYSYDADPPVYTYIITAENQPELYIAIRKGQSVRLFAESTGDCNAVWPTDRWMYHAYAGPGSVSLEGYTITYQGAWSHYRHNSEDPDSRRYTYAEAAVTVYAVIE